MLVDAFHAAFEDTEVAFDGIGVCLPANVFSNAVADGSGKMQQHCEPRGAFHQSADRRSAQADDQVTFPVSG